jgi:hypothetical protein
MDALLGTSPSNITGKYYGEAAQKAYDRMRVIFNFVEDALLSKQCESK